MTEPIKQEIINNIFENGDKLITGPILQTVLIDMIDDVNGKDQEILNKTGSWDDAVTQIPNLATKEEVTNLSESVARDIANVDVDLTGYATEQWVESQGYLKEHQDISNLATKTELNDTKNNLQGNITSLSESVANSAVLKKGTGTDSIVQVITGANEANLPTATGTGSIAVGSKTTALGNYSHAEGNWTRASGANSHAEGGGTEASGQSSHAEGDYTKASGMASHTEGYYTTASNYYSHAEGFYAKATGENSHAEGSGSNASGMSSHAEGNRSTASGMNSHAEGYDTTALGDNSHAEGGNTTASNDYEHAQGQYNHNSTNQIFSIGAGEMTPDYNINRRNALSVLVVPNADTKINTASFFVQNIGGYDGTNPTPGTNDLATVISEVSSTWKKDTGTDSIVQAIASGYHSPTATGIRAIAVGESTNASGQGSHAEGNHTNASGQYSHAEGNYANASGDYSHAEGDFTKAEGNYSHAEGVYSIASGYYSHAEGQRTIASNRFEHAQGRFNHSSENQIFSVGAGENANGTETRRNAVSILAVPNSETQINTASFFVQNIGGYDGTNPTPGTNDLATVINGMSTGGGSSETLWKKGEGTDAIVQILTGNNETNISTATGTSSIATGYRTNASGNWSHTEGFKTEASGMLSHAEGYCVFATGNESHAEGYFTNASGDHSHAEGDHTEASNQNEHAQGQYNHSSTNQIFSVGAGENANGTITKRNAVSILAVPNSETQVLTASFFVQNVGGYDGTNPTPGTNDLATVINGMSSSGGSSETLWEKGTGKNSIVQKVTDTALTEPIASGLGAVAIGDQTRASGFASHAEGYWTEAKGNYSHAEGRENTAEGVHSHTEGFNTIASNSYEHAQGIRNYSSTNQIFSVGAGDYTGDYVEASNRRRNAISVLAVPNADTQVVTASFFVQNIGGYDGTNPTPGTNDLATVISGLSSGGGSSETLWKKGTGTDSIVQKLTGDFETYTPSATGIGAVAIGSRTTASGQWSHAEGYEAKASGYTSHAEGLDTNASGYSSHAEGGSCTAYAYYSHAEGQGTIASGWGSHTEGKSTIASNDYEHAQGRFNHSSENQIFSIGTGNSSEDRRNAVSVLEVSNNNSYTSSFFVQNIGGYDGTNPIPGTNDLATVINGISSSGGTGTSTETWTFTLDNGSTVTKNIVMR